MSEWTRRGSAAGRLGAPRAGARSGASCTLASTCWRGVRSTLKQHGYLILAALALALVAFLALHPHVHLLESAFGNGGNKFNKTSQDGKDTSNLVGDIKTLTSDATYVLVPSVSLAGAVGATFWALGSRRGPTIVGGALVAGIVGAGLDVIVN